MQLTKQLLSVTLLVAFICGASTAQLSHNGSLTVTTQLALDTFAYTHVYGNFLITDGAENNPDPILDLGPLASLRYVAGRVEISENSRLKYVDGTLDSLLYAGGGLNLSANDSLVVFRGLRLAKVPPNRSVLTGLNPVMTTLDAFNGVDSIRQFSSYKNESLSDIHILQQLRYVGWEMIFNDWDTDTVSFPELRWVRSLKPVGLNRLDYLDAPQLDSIVVLEFAYNHLTHFSGLQALKWTVGVYMYENDHLQSFSCFDTPFTIGSYCRIYRNEKLVDLSGFANLRQMGGHADMFGNTYPTVSFSAYENPNLKNLDGLDSMSCPVRFGIGLMDNDSLKYISALQNVTNVLNIHIVRNGNLHSLHGIHNASDTLWNRIEIKDNHHKPHSMPADEMEYSGLTEVVGFDSLRHVVGDCEIWGDDRLTHVDAFHNLESVGGVFILRAGNFHFDLQGIYRTATKLRSAKSVGLINFYGYEPIPLDSLRETESMGIHGFPGVEIIEGIPNLRRLGGGNYHGGFGFHHMKSALQFGDLFHPDLVRIESVTATQPGVARVRNSPKITSLAGLTEFQKINGEVYIANTPALTDISNFYQLDSLTGNVVLIDVPLLQDCTPLCHLRENGYWPGEIETFGVVNPPCRSVEELLSLTCSPVETEDLPETVATELRAYPNPFGTAFSVRLSAPGTGRLLLYDALGRTHLEQAVSPPQTEWTLPTEQLPPGMYYLVFRDANREVTVTRAVWRQ